MGRLFAVARGQAVPGAGGIRFSDLDEVVFYGKPLLKFEWLLETNLSYAPKGFRSFLLAMPVWLKEELCLKAVLKKRWPNSAAASSTSIQRSRLAMIR
mgnify:FL=1